MDFLEKSFVGRARNFTEHPKMVDETVNGLVTLRGKEFKKLPENDGFGDFRVWVKTAEW